MEQVKLQIIKYQKKVFKFKKLYEFFYFATLYLGNNGVFCSFLVFLIRNLGIKN